MRVFIAGSLWTDHQLLCAPQELHALPAFVQGFGVYRFAKKYGANVDGYSPIYTPDTWSESGNEYKLGSKGLLAWCACLQLAHTAPLRKLRASYATCLPLLRPSVRVTAGPAL